MDEFICTYGFYTIYNKTWFLYRKNEYIFCVSKPVESSTVSAANSVSVREAMLYLALKAQSPQESECPPTFGRSLVSNKHLEKHNQLETDFYM
jgi:hypothetical protein